MGTTTVNLFNNRIHAVGDFGKQNNVRSPSDTRPQSQPSGSVSHDFSKNNAVVRVRRRVQTVQSLSGNL